LPTAPVEFAVPAAAALPWVTGAIEPMPAALNAPLIGITAIATVR
jgi:hypothetical protein